MFVDLHLHTNRSDGAMAPDELLRHLQATQPTLSYVSITDHDNISAYEEIDDSDYTFKIIKGVELSTFSDTEYHILGYGYNDNFSTEIDKIRQLRHDRNILMLERLRELGKPINEELFDREDVSTGRLLMAQEMTRLGYVSSVENAFLQYLNKGAPAYVQSKKLTPKEAIDIIHANGGKAVFAHPFSVKSTRSIPTIVAEFALYGLDGMECYYPTFSPKNTAELEQLAAKYKLFTTGGSDFHSLPREVGQTVPDSSIISLFSSTTK